MNNNNNKKSKALRISVKNVDEAMSEVMSAAALYWLSRDPVLGFTRWQDRLHLTPYRGLRFRQPVIWDKWLSR